LAAQKAAILAQVGHFYFGEVGQYYFGANIQGLLERRNANVAAVAMANKTARIVWALLAKARQYDRSTCPGP